MRSAPEKPDWLLQLEQNGGYIEIGILPHNEVSSTETSTKLTVTVNGDAKDVLGEKDSITSVSFFFSGLTGLIV